MDTANLIIPIIDKKGNKVTDLLIFNRHNLLEPKYDCDAILKGESCYQLYESSTYEYKFSLEGYSLKPNEFIEPFKSNPNGGLIITRNFVGTTVPIKVFYNNCHVASIDFEIQSEKTDYRTDYQGMLNNIAQYYTELVMMSGAPTTQSFEVDINADAEADYLRFAFLKNLVSSEEFANAIHEIQYNPIKRWTEYKEERSILNVGRLQSNDIKQIASSPNRVNIPQSHPLNKVINTIPKSINVLRKRESVDNNENQVIKHILNVFLIFCQSVQKRRGINNRLKNEAISIYNIISNYLNVPFFKEISSPSSLQLNSPALQRKEGYREILQGWTLFELSANLNWTGGENVYKAGMRNVAALYEYWVYLKLISIVEDVFHLQKTDIGRLVENKNDRLNLNLKQGKQTIVYGNDNLSKRPLKVALFFNRTFARHKEVYRGTWTVNMRPDYTLAIWPSYLSLQESEKENKIIYIHFDAKYKYDIELFDNYYETNNTVQDDFADDVLGKEADDKINELKESFVENGINNYDFLLKNYKRSDLLKMHAYKDAIRRTSGAYLIYPGNCTDENKMRLKGYHEIIPGLGAFTLRPSDNPEYEYCNKDDIEALKSFIIDVKENFINVTSQRGQMAYFEHEVHKTN